MTKNWINFRFLHICPVEKCEISPNLAKIHISPHLLCGKTEIPLHVEKFHVLKPEISPHGRFLLHLHVGDRGDKYQVWCHIMWQIPLQLNRERFSFHFHLTHFALVGETKRHNLLQNQNNGFPPPAAKVTLNLRQRPIIVSDPGEVGELPLLLLLHQGLLNQVSPHLILFQSKYDKRISSTKRFLTCKPFTFGWSSGFGSDSSTSLSSLLKCGSNSLSLMASKSLLVGLITAPLLITAAPVESLFTPFASSIFSLGGSSLSSPLSLSLFNFGAIVLKQWPIGSPENVKSKVNKSLRKVFWRDLVYLWKWPSAAARPSSHASHFHNVSRCLPGGGTVSCNKVDELMNFCPVVESPKNHLFLTMESSLNTSVWIRWPINLTTGSPAQMAFCLLAELQDLLKEWITWKIQR